MNEESGKKDRPEKDKSTRPLYDSATEIQQAKEESRARHSNKSQPEHRPRSLSWYNPLNLTVTFILGFATLIVMFGQLGVDQIDTVVAWQKDRARVVASSPRDVRIEAESDLSFSLVFKNMGGTAALNPYGAWLQGECPHASSQQCIQWCLEPLRETQGEGYDPLDFQGQHTEEFSYTLKTGRARKKQRPVYFCGYFAYTDVFCMWRRQFYVFSYDSSSEFLSTHILRNDEEEAQAQNCSPYRRLYK